MSVAGVALRGACLCGAVSFEVDGPLRPVVYCHCRQCRRSSGHFVAATSAASAGLRMLEDKGLRWYRSSPEAQRGFCGVCGSSVFWRNERRDTVSIMAGALDEPTGLEAASHIFVDNAGDYYRIGDGLPQYAQYGPDRE